MKNISPNLVLMKATKLQRTIRTRFASLAIALAAVGALFFGHSSAFAATQTWQNTVNTDFNAGGSWLSGTAPTSGDTALFNAAEVTNPNLSASLSIGALSFSAGASGYTLSASASQSLTLTGASPITNSITSGTNTISANLILSGGGTKSFNGASSGTTAITGNISETGGAATVQLFGGSSIWTLSGSNSFSGGVSSGNSNMILNIGNANALGTGALTVGNNNFTVNNISVGALTFANALNLSSASGDGIRFASTSNNVTFNGAVTLSGAGSNGNRQKVITKNANTVVTFAGSVGGGAFGIEKRGPGTLVLSGSNSFTGAIQVSTGEASVGSGFDVLQFATRNALYGGGTSSWTAANISTSAVANGQTAVLAFNVGGSGEFTSSDIDILKGMSTSTTNGFVGGSVLGLDTTNASGGNFVYNTNITDTNGGNNSIGLMKLGTNQLTLGGSNSYTGATTVQSGTLAVNGSINSTTTTTVNSGATLLGSGTVGAVTVSAGGTLAGTLHAGAVTVNAGGTIAPGNSLGIINSGNFSLSGKLSADVGKAGAGQPVAGTDYDQVNVTGSVTLSGADLTLTIGTGVQVGDIYFLIKNDGVDAVAGTFTKLNGVTTTLTEGSTFTAGGDQFKITYLANAEGSAFTGGNDVALQVTTIPEPSTYGMVAAGFAMLLGLQGLRRGIRRN